MPSRIHSVTRAPIAHVSRILPGMDHLYTPTISINGASHTCDFMFFGGDALSAGGGTWADRSANSLDLTLEADGVGAAAMTFGNAGMYTKTNEDKLTIPGTTSQARWENVGASTAIGTKDFIHEFIMAPNANSSQWYAYVTNWDAVNTDGWFLGHRSGYEQIIWMGYNKGTASYAYGAWPASYGTLHHIVIAMNRSGTTTDDLVCVVDGEIQTSVGYTIPTSWLNFDIAPTAGQFAIDGYANGVSPTAGTIGPGSVNYVAQWIGTDMLQEGAACSAEIANFARTRFAMLTGGSMNLFGGG